MATTTGTKHASASTMRTIPAVALVALLGGCLGAKVGGGGGGGSRPGVMPMLSELPGDPEKRNTILDASAQTAGPEHRKGMTRQERKAETAAATAAAIIGSMFSKTQNVTLGAASTFDENLVIAPETAPPSPSGSKDGAEPGADKTDGAGPEPGPLVPWIKLTPQAK